MGGAEAIVGGLPFLSQIVQSSLRLAARFDGNGCEPALPPWAVWVVGRSRCGERRWLCQLGFGGGDLFVQSRNLPLVDNLHSQQHNLRAVNGPQSEPEQKRQQ